MALIDNLHFANNAQNTNYQAFYIENECIGYIHKKNRALLEEAGLKLIEKQQNLHWQTHNDLKKNSLELEKIFKKLKENNHLKDWRNEKFPLAKDRHSKIHALIERAAVPYLGCRGYGVHINGLLQKKQELYMWLGKRSINKSTYPGQLDQMVAGGLPYGISAFLNMQKECLEEAGIKKSLSEKANATGIISYYHETEEGLRADIMLNYDLFLPEHFHPKNQDGEVEEFILLPLREIINTLKKPHNIKFNSALSIIDCAIRHGILDDEEKDYLEICHLLRAQTQPFIN